MKELKAKIKDNVTLNQLNQIAQRDGIEIVFDSGKAYWLVGYWEA